jgi:hypothetical protein
VSLVLCLPFIVPGFWRPALDSGDMTAHPRLLLGAGPLQPRLQSQSRGHAASVALRQCVGLLSVPDGP